MDRRLFVAGLGCAAVWPAPAFADLTPRLGALEARTGGRLGVAVLDGSGRLAAAYRGDERFATASTFKLLLAACVLARIDAGVEEAERVLAYGPGDLMSVSPVTEANLGGSGLPVLRLCQAVVEQSDNAAANLLLKTVGGPAGLTAWLRRVGDPVTRLDRTEPTLNEARPGDPRDTTSPAAMASTVRRLLTGVELSRESRALLADWMVGKPHWGHHAAGGATHGLAGRGQDRTRRPWVDKRCGRDLAGGAGAVLDRGGLPDRMHAAHDRAGGGDRAGRPAVGG